MEYEIYETSFKVFKFECYGVEHICLMPGLQPMCKHSSNQMVSKKGIETFSDDRWHLQT